MSMVSKNARFCIILKHKKSPFQVEQGNGRSACSIQNDVSRGIPTLFYINRSIMAILCRVFRFSWWYFPRE